MFSSSFLVRLTCSFTSSANIIWTSGSTTVCAASPSPMSVVSGIPSCVAIVAQFGAVMVEHALVSTTCRISPPCWHLMAILLAICFVVSVYKSADLLPTNSYVLRNVTFKALSWLQCRCSWCTKPACSTTKVSVTPSSARCFWQHCSTGSFPAAPLEVWAANCC